MYPQMTQIHPLTLISRDRLLPVPGEINVRPGQKVNPCDVVAQASIPSRHYLVDVGRVLGAQNADAAEKLITRKTGDLLEKNDIIAETGGMFSRVIRTPGPGEDRIHTQGQSIDRSRKRSDQAKSRSFRAHQPGDCGSRCIDRNVWRTCAGSVGQWQDRVRAIER